MNDINFALRSNKATILIVEDEQDIRKAMYKTLEKQGFQVLEASGERAAMDMYCHYSERIDLIVTDLLMEDQHSGSRLINWLSQEKKTSCRIGIWTAHGQMDDLGRQVRQPNVDFYLPKDSGLKSLKRFVEEALADRKIVIQSRKKWRPLPFKDNFKDKGLVEKQAEGTHWSVVKSAFLESSDEPKDLDLVEAEIKFTLGLLEYGIVETQEGTFHELRGPNLRLGGTPGQPALPFAVQRLALSGFLVNITACLKDPEWVSVAGRYRLLPFPDPTVEAEQPSYTMNMKTYLRSEKIPSQVLTVDSKSIMVDGVPCALARLYPVRHNPRTGSLEVLKSATVHIEGLIEAQVDGPSLTPDPYSPMRDLVLDWPEAYEPPRRVELSVDSPGGGPTGPAKVRHNGGRPPSNTLPKARYLAVGTEEGLRAIDPLLNLHRQQLEVSTAVIGDDILIADEGTPKQRQSAIHRYLELRSSQIRTRPQYVLLVGGDATIPYFRYPNYKKCITTTSGIPILSDMWYTNFESVGSTGPAFALGRLPFDDPDKLKQYCATWVGNGCERHWRFWAFLSGNEEHYKSQVDKILKRYGKNVYLANCKLGPAIDAKLKVSTDQIDDTLSVAPSIATFRGHGLRSSWVIKEGLNWCMAARPFRPDQPLDGVLSMACCTASQDQPELDCGSCEMVLECKKYPPLGITWIESGAAAWFLGSSRKSFTLVNDDFHDFLMEAMCNEGILNIGRAFRRAIGRLLEAPEQVGVEDNVAMSTLLGDPAWPIPSVDTK